MLSLQKRRTKEGEGEGKQTGIFRKEDAISQGANANHVDFFFISSFLFAKLFF